MGQHRIGGFGEIVDWAVKMVRLPDARRADILLENGRLSGVDIDRVGEYIARFHADMPTNSDIARFGSPEVISANVRENFAQTRDTICSHLGRDEAGEIEAKQVAFIEEHRDLLAARMQGGRVRDRHGDLRLEHVYLASGEPPTIIDCIEFNERFRYADVCADIAFLSMDLKRLGRVDLAERFLAAYARASGDYDLYQLVDFYEGYRAYVRGKVGSILNADTGADFETRERAGTTARRSYLLALSEGRKALFEPVMIVVGGLIASGKSTIAERIAPMLSAPVIDADRTRKAILGVEPTTKIPEKAWTGAYAPDVTDRVYAELFRRASVVLTSGRPVVLDASFRSRALRAVARRLAQKHGAPFYFVECRADAEECRRRLRQREQDARLEIFEEFAARWEPVAEFPKAAHIVIDTSVPLDVNVDRLRHVLPTWPRGFTA